MILCVEKPKEWKKKLKWNKTLKIDEFSKIQVAIINIQKSTVFPYACNKQSETKIFNVFKIPFPVAPK